MKSAERLRKRDQNNTDEYSVVLNAAKRPTPQRAAGIERRERRYFFVVRGGTYTRKKEQKKQLTAANKPDNARLFIFSVNRATIVASMYPLS